MEKPGSGARMEMGNPGKYFFPMLAAATFLCACASLPTGDHGGPPLSSPGEYLARGMSEVEAADKVRQEKSPIPAMGGVFSWPPDREKWLGHLRQAEADFQAVLERFPGSPEAAESQFMLGRIKDHPYMNRFDDALEEYRRTVKGYPGSPAAEKAQQRIGIIEAIRK
jgi:hypothetical protein